MACLVTIPDCTVAHVLGPDSEPVILGQGNLEVVESAPTSLEAAPSASPLSERRSTEASRQSLLLTLKIGNAAFPLSSSTVIYTDATNKNNYYFAPELGPGISGSVPGRGPGGMGAGKGGYIQLLLPSSAESKDLEEGNRERHQEVFERLLIERSLLQKGENRSLTWDSVKSSLGKVFARDRPSTR